MPRLAWALCLVGLACTASGVTSGPGPARPAVEGRAAAMLPEPAAALYATDPGTGGVVGGEEAIALGRAVAGALRERGNQAVPDETLGRLAAWYLEEVGRGRNPSSPESVRAARRLGFVGAVHVAVVFPLPGSEAEMWRQALADIPRNLPVTRYGVRVSADGGAAAVAFAAVELTLEPFPRHFAPGQSLRLRGEISGRYDHGNVFLTGTTGTVGQTRLPARRVDVSLPLLQAGTYEVEVMGDGATGPVVLANVPVYVGVPEPDAGQPVEGAQPDAGDTAERMLALLNRGRSEAGLAPLAPDPELRAVALAHSRDMVAGHFFGHVSPTTGTVEDRLRRAAVVVSIAGENVAQGESAESAYRGLMDSPGHRANMLGAKFTHVGIGVAPTNAQPPLIATLVFGRRPPSPARLTATEVLSAISALRRSKGVRPIAADPMLQAAAEAGVKAFASGAAPSPERAIDVGNAALRREALRLNVARGAGCASWLEILELDDLAQFPLLAKPGLRRVGLAVTLQASGKLPELGVLVLVEGSGCG